MFLHKLDTLIRLFEMASMWYMWLSRGECQELGRVAYPTWEIEIFLPSPTVTWSAIELAIAMLLDIMLNIGGLVVSIFGKKKKKRKWST